MFDSLLVPILAMASGLMAPPPQQPLCASSITIGTIFVDNSSTTTLVGDTMALRVAVTSACQTQSVVADAFGHSAPLSFDPGKGAWTGNFPLASDPHTAFTLTITATDINGATASRTKDLIHDTPPVVTVTLPTPSSVARPLLHVAATCSDDDPAGCVTMTVSVVSGPLGGTVLASGSPLDQDVSLASFENVYSSVVLTFNAVDTRGQITKAPPTRLVYVASNPRLSEVTHAPGQILDDSPDRTLFLNNDADPSMLDKGTGQITPLTTSDPRFREHAYGRFTTHGAIFVAQIWPPPFFPPYELFELRDGVLADLGGVDDSLHVAGDYAIWTDRYGSVQSLFRRDLQAGTTLTVADSPNGYSIYGRDVASNGDVVYSMVGYSGQITYQIYRYQGGATTQLTSSIAYNIRPATDGINVAYTQVDDLGNMSTRLITNSGDVMLADFAGWVGLPDPGPGFYAVNGGWTAFTKPSAADINVWLRAPDGTQSQVSFFGGRSEILFLNSDRAVAIGNNGRLWLAEPNHPLMDLATSWPPFTRAFWRDDEPFVIIGGSVFKVNVAPVILTQPLNQTVAAGQTATFGVVASGTNPLGYQWYVGTSGDTTTPIGGATSSSYTTPPLASPLTSPTKYWVRVANAAGNADSTTASISVSFNDDPVVAGVSRVKAVHITELRTRIEAVRAHYGLAAYQYTNPMITAGASIIRTVDILDLRAALAEAYIAALRAPPTYSTSPAPGAPITVADIAELRAALLVIE